MNAHALTRRPPALPLIITALVAYWLAVVAAMHLLEPEFDPVAVPMSAYVVGAYGVWMTTSFFAAAAIWFLLAFGLAKVLPPTWWTKAGIVLFCIAGCGEVVMGFFPAQWPIPQPVPQQIVIHLIGGLATFYAVALGSISFSVSFRGADRWRPVSTAAIVVSILMFATLMYRWVWRPLSDMDGLIQRIIVALMLVWFALVVIPWIRWAPRAEPAAGVGTSASAGA